MKRLKKGRNVPEVGFTCFFARVNATPVWRYILRPGLGEWLRGLVG